MIFTDLKPKDIEKMAKIGERRLYPKGSEVIREGTQGDTFGIIICGRVEIRKSITKEKSTAVVELSTNDLIGELGFFGLKYRTASVMALEDTEIIEFSRKKFEVYMLDNPKMGVLLYRNMAQILAERLGKTDHKLGRALFWAFSPRTPGVLPTFVEKLRHNTNLSLKK
jgi:CRP-like cAMP-binding protein